MAAVLVVEDDLDTQHLMARWLERDGHIVSVAEDGQHALDLAGQADYDLVVLDVSLPDFDGYEVVRRLPRPATARLLMCSVRDREDAPRELHLDSWLNKPFSQAELLAAVADALDGCDA